MEDFIKLTREDALALAGRVEGDFFDRKAAKIDGRALQKIAVAFANADGGEVVVGIADDKDAPAVADRWQGLPKLMLVTGVAQLAIAPVAVALERRVDVRLLTGIGFALFAVGLGLSAAQTPQTDYDAMFWPQVIRGLAIMFCLLPPTRLALGQLPEARVTDASGLFNLMRNLGGAIGLALIDTVIYSQSPVHGTAIMERLQAGDVETAKFIGLPLELMAARPPGRLDLQAEALLQQLVEKAALVQSINQAWALIAVLTIAALGFVPFARKVAAGDPVGA